MYLLHEVLPEEISFSKLKSFSLLLQSAITIHGLGMIAQSVVCLIHNHSSSSEEFIS